MQTGLNAQFIIYKNLARYFQYIPNFYIDGVKNKSLSGSTGGLNLTSYSIQIGIQREAFDTIDLES